jgi:hypothetical protein
MTSTSIGQHTFQLFACPSFIEGVGQLVDVMGVLNTYADSETGVEADAKAVGSDWKAVGEDIRTAMIEYERTQGEEYQR